MNRWHINSIADNEGHDVFVGGTLSITDNEGSEHQIVVDSIALKDGMLFVNNILLDIIYGEEKNN